MACNSVAVTSSQITQVLLDQAGLKAALAGLLGVDESQIKSDQYTSTYGKRGLVLYAWHQDQATGNQVYWIQENGKLELTVTNDRGLTVESRQKLDKFASDLQTKAGQVAIVAQQKQVLRRLAQLGKLSNVQQKDNGIVARLEVTI